MLPVVIISVSLKWAIGPTEFAWPNLYLLIAKIGLTEFMQSVTSRWGFALTLAHQSHQVDHVGSYVSNVSIIFDCSTLLYYHSWIFYNHFISFLVLTYWHSAKCQLLFFTSQEINTKRSPNAAKLFVDFFGTEDIQWAERSTWGGAPSPSAPWWVVLPPEHPP